MAQRTNKKPQSLETDAGVITYLLTRSSRRRTMMIRIEENAEVRVFAPFYTTISEIQGFVREKSHWIRDKLEEARQNFEVLQNRSFEDGQEFLFLGKKHRLELVANGVLRPKVEFDGLKWKVFVPHELGGEERQRAVKNQMIRWYRQQAEEVIGGRIFHYARQIGAFPEKIAVRTQKRIWGSCDPRGKIIHINWQIILSPLDVVDYVVVHELCHLKVSDHSKRFWGEVEQVLPDYKRRQKWLKTNRLDMTLP